MSNTYYKIKKKDNDQNDLSLTAFVGTYSSLQITIGCKYILLNEKQQIELAMQILARANKSISAVDEMILGKVRKNE